MIGLVPLDEADPLTCTSCGHDCAASPEDANFLWFVEEDSKPPSRVVFAAVVCKGQCDRRASERANKLGLFDKTHELAWYVGAEVRGTRGVTLADVAADGALARLVKHLSVGLDHWEGEPLRTLLAVCLAAGQLSARAAPDVTF